jgi:hypothetical protein
MSRCGTPRLPAKYCDHSTDVHPYAALIMAAINGLELLQGGLTRLCL